MQKGGLVVVLALALLALLLMGGPGSALVEAFSHKSTSTGPAGIKLTRAALAQMSAHQSGRTGTGLYWKVPPCVPRILPQRRKVCECDGDGVRPSFEFPGGMCSPHDQVFV